jgi:hypothetical protein
MNKQVVEKVVDITFNGYVRTGPHLWVSKLLYSRGALSSKKIWDEFIKDQSVDKDLIASKTFLK